MHPCLMGPPDGFMTTLAKNPLLMEPRIAKRGPYVVEAQSGKTYYWCACGDSKSQPFCDGSHQGTEFNPTAYTPAATSKAYFCGCKHTTKKPLCDGSHNKL